MVAQEEMVEQVEPEVMAGILQARAANVIQTEVPVVMAALVVLAEEVEMPAMGAVQTRE